MVQLVLADFTAESVAVYSQGFGRSGLVSVKPFENSLDEFLLEFRDRFFE